MRILYVFPHPDDESFTAGAAIAAQKRIGDDVCLLTLTRGGATKQRHRLGLSVEAMGAIRFQEMQAVARVLDLDDLTVLDLPDSGLKELDPREIEAVVREHAAKVRPDVLVTYAVHGISGFHDHLVSHAVVKRVFCEMRASGLGARRLALLTLAEELPGDTPIKVSISAEAEIDAVVETSEADREKGRQSLACYTTYKEVIDRAGVENLVPPRVHFEIFQEEHRPVLGDLCAGL